MADTNKRLIEVAFPLKQASLDSMHEKNVRHGHISTLHIWPARRPLAASRAALVATLLPDPGNKDDRTQLLEKLGGKIVEVVKRKKLPSGKVEEKVVPETVGGVLHWGRESNPDLEWFRRKIREAYDGRAPRVLDPFAGGGAIPLEAMRLGCEVTAIDVNPVAWFVLQCTLQYSQGLAGQHCSLPRFALESTDFMEQFFRSTGKLTTKQLERNLAAVQERLFPAPEVDLAWHIRAWGWWILQRAKLDLERYYPIVDGEEPAAYLWARTVKCKNCRATIPLLKTRWLCKKEKSRILLTMEPNPERKALVFGLQRDVPQVGGNTAQRREYDKRIGVGTMSRSGVSCPSCNGAIMTIEEIRAEGMAGRIGSVLTAVVVEANERKAYRPPTETEILAASEAEASMRASFEDIPFGLPDEPVPKGGSGASRAFSVDGYGLDRWSKLFTPRQLLAISTFVRHTRAASSAIRAAGYTDEWVTAIYGLLATGLDRLVDRCSAQCRPDPTPTQSGVINTFSRFALPIIWDFIEGVPTADSSGGYLSCLEWVAKVTEHLSSIPRAPKATVLQQSALKGLADQFDVICTDPPYYDAIPYSDLMDFFYVWLRRTLYGSDRNTDAAFREPLAPKWNHETNDGELIDDSSRFGGDKTKSKKAYENGMFKAFEVCHRALKSEGRMVVVFANKQPDAWEALVSAIIRAGFVVDGSWPIQTEMGNRTRALSSAALASSVWLVCKRRPEIARPGWDNTVLTEMFERIQSKLREFWDAGIRGPDFVWAATGPALEVYSKHPVVKKANAAGEFMTVSEFLSHVRRLVVDFIVGQVLSHNGAGESVSGLDNVTTYYILHRYDFGFADAPIGACILYAVSCGLTDRELTDRYEVLSRTSGSDSEDEASEDEDVTEEEPESGPTSSNKVKLKIWSKRHGKGLGLAPDGRPAPLIDQIHKLMGLWKLGDVVKVDEYLDGRALRRNSIFIQLMQALIELSQAGSDERAILESLSNHVAARGVAYEDKQLPLGS
jgi:adenine-specific DNA methylase